MQSSPKVSKVSAIDSTAEAVKTGILSGHWKHRLPGQARLAKELGVSRKTVGSALARLVAAGVLPATERRKASVLPESPRAPAKIVATRALRVAFFLNNPVDTLVPEARDSLMNLKRTLQLDGHSTDFFTFPKGKNRHKTGALPRLVADAAADAWIVYDATEDVLKWFAASGLTVMALGGRSAGIEIATLGTTYVPTVAETVRRLATEGHRKIVMITPDHWRNPTPGIIVKQFRQSLTDAGVTPGEYHTPDWTETPEGLAELMDALFRVTPPTAIYCATMNSTCGVLAWLARHGLTVPGDVSLVAIWREPSAAWYYPGLRIAHAASNDEEFVRKLRQWVSGVARGKIDTRKHLLAPEFDAGNSIGPAKRTA